MSNIKSTCLLTLLLLLTSSLAAENYCDDEGAWCVSCINVEGDQVCENCLFDWSNRKCNHRTSIEKCLSPKVDRQADPKICNVCVVGYVLSEDKKSCPKSTDPNCLVGKIENGKLKCLYCKKEKLNREATCVDMPSDFKKIEHCEYHAEKNDTTECSLCEDGYSLDMANEEDVNTNKCIPECTKGCEICQNSTCRQCNVWKGYFMTSIGACSHRDYPEGFGNGLDASKTFGKVLSLCLTGFTALSLFFW